MLIDNFLAFFSHDLAVDLGTSNLKIFVRHKGLMVNEPAVVARHKKTKIVFASGFEAKRMIGRVSSEIEVVRPIKEGVVSDFDAALFILKKHIENLHRSYGLVPKIPKPKVVVSVPSDLSEVEKKAATDVLKGAGARKVIPALNLMAAAVGAGYNFATQRGLLIVDIGASTTEIGVVSTNGIILSRCLKIGGNDFDKAISNFIRLKYGVLIGEQTAEEIKIAIGCLPSAKHVSEGKFAVARGRDLESGLPRSVRIGGGEVSETLTPLVNRITDQIKEMVEKAPPEFLGDLADSGIIFVGGGSLIKELAQFVTEATKIPAWVLKDPSLVTVRGMGKALNDRKLLAKL